MQLQSQQHYPVWAQALKQCGGNAHLSECAQYPFSAWLKASEDENCQLSYWPWVWAKATADGIPIETLSESEASYRRRTTRLPGAVH